MSAKSVDVFNASQNRMRVANFKDEEERENAEYAERHNLQSLFSEFAAQLREKEPKTESEAERVLLDLLSHRKAERDRAALRLHFKHSFEVNLDNGRKVLKLTTGGVDNGSLQILQKTRSASLNDQFDISIEQVEELTELFYELGRFAVDTVKGEQYGFINIDERDVYLLAGGKDCSDIGDELFNVAILMKSSSSSSAW